MSRWQTKKFVKKEIAQLIGSDWEKLSSIDKKEITEDLIDIIYEETQKSESTLQRIKSRKENYKFLIIGAAFGVSGGLIANIIHSLFSNHMYIYISLSIIIFLATCIISSFYIRYRNNLSIQNNEGLNHLLKKAKGMLKAENTTN